MTADELQQYLDAKKTANNPDTNPWILGSGMFDAINSKYLDDMIKQRPTYSSIRDENGNLLDQFKLKAQPNVGFNSNIEQLMQQLSGINLDKTALNKLQDTALSTDNSPWANLMLQKNDVDTASAMDKAGLAGNAATGSAFSDLARRGGISAGARERLATKGERNTMMAKQGVGRDAETNRLGILTNDANQKMDILKQLPGMQVQSLQPELAKTGMWGQMADSEAARKQGLDVANRDYATGVDKTNLASSIGDVKNKQDFDMTQYQELMKAWAANKQADATANSGKK